MLKKCLILQPAASGKNPCGSSQATRTVVSPSSLIYGKIGYIALKEDSLQKIPSKDLRQEKYHRKTERSLDIAFCHAAL